MRGPGRGDEGMVTAFVIIFSTALLFTTALALDGGRMLTAHQEARNVAASAARAGAQMLDDEAIRAGREVILDPEAAQTAACALLNEADHPCGGGTDVVIDGNQVNVTVHDTVELFLLPGGGRPLNAEGSACVARGITESTSADCG